LRLDRLNLFELYNGVKLAHEAKPELGLEETVKHLEATYEQILLENDKFLQLSSDSF
jgi:hypothetical protein